MSAIGSPGAADETVPDGFTAEDLHLGKEVTRNLRVLCLIAFVVCVAIAGFVFVNVPWDTRLPYDGRYDRSGKGIPMQIALLPALVLLVRIWWDGRRPDAHHMRKGSRVGAYILCGGLLGASVFCQWIMARGILAAGGFFAG